MMENITIYTQPELIEMGWGFTFGLGFIRPNVTFLSENFNKNTEGLTGNFSIADFAPYYEKGGVAAKEVMYSDGALSTTSIQNVEMQRVPVFNNQYATIIKTNVGFFIKNLYVDSLANFSLTVKYSTLTSGNSIFRVGIGQVDTRYFIQKTLCSYGNVAQQITLDYQLETVNPNRPYVNVLISRIGNGPLCVGDLYIEQTAMSAYTITVQKTFTSLDKEERIYSFTLTGFLTKEEAINAACAYASAIEYGEKAAYLTPDPTMIFPTHELYQWISPQQLAQFKDMYPECIQSAYKTATGYLFSQLGHLYDIEAILSNDPEVDECSKKVVSWLMSVLTAYNLSSSCMLHSQVLVDNFNLAIKKITEIKTGASALYKAPIAPTPNAWGKVVNNKKNQMLG